MNITPTFLKHLPNCSECKADIAHLNHESKILILAHKHRNKRFVRSDLLEPSWAQLPRSTFCKKGVSENLAWSVDLTDVQMRRVHIVTGESWLRLLSEIICEGRLNSPFDLTVALMRRIL